MGFCFGLIGNLIATLVSLAVLAYAAGVLARDFKDGTLPQPCDLVSVSNCPRIYFEDRPARLRKEGPVVVVNVVE